jgi:aspartyl aminopeptidase
VTTQQHIQHLLDFIDASPSPWHVVATIEKMLSPLRFIKLDESSRWHLQASGRYYVVRDDSSIIIVILGSKPILDTGFKIIGAHTDSPGLRIKPNPLNIKSNPARLNVEIYGSPILATFTDRDLSLAGRVTYQTAQGLIGSQLVNFDKPLLRLPNLAIHMNRSVNEDGLKLHKQNELSLLLMGLPEQIPHDYFQRLLQQTAQLDSSTILAWDLAVYDTQPGAVWGAQEEFYSDSQLDNLASCHAALQAMLNDKVMNSDNTLVCAFFDHEEIGSESNKGADGNFLPDVLQRITASLQPDSDSFSRIMAKSFLISADMAHAFHPNFPGAYDLDHSISVNQGPAIKINANQRYSSESVSEALFINWCQQANAPYQRYSHRCDLPCGSTIGPITSAKLGIRSVDIGNPMWAMHSLRESAGVYDHNHLINVFRTFFNAPFISSS